MAIGMLDTVLKKLGYISKKEAAAAGMADIKLDQRFMRIYKLCQPFTMTSMERLFSLYCSVNHIIDHEIEGDLVECGVWKGGSSMMMALALLERGVRSRDIFLYDTFEGMSEPTEDDRTFQGSAASDLLQEQSKNDEQSIWCYSSLEDVRNNIYQTEYPTDRIHFVKGKVEDTIPHTRPGRISLLRLDTDWYASTKTELEYLYPLLSQQGILIIDEFGHWEGAKKAVIEYFGNKSPMLHRIDNTGRILVKP
jgi:hypothetical protein